MSFKALFQWLDAHPAVPGILAGIAVLVVAGYACVACRSTPARKTSGRRADYGAWILLLVLLLAWRWPALLEINSTGFEEAELLTTAYRMADDPIPFRTVDPGGSGVVPALLLLPGHWLGLPADYFAARMLALLMDWGTLVLLHGLLRRFAGGATAILTLVPLVLVMAMPQVPALYEYRGWHTTLFLAAVAVRSLLACAEARTPVWQGRRGWLIAGGCLALLPWTSRSGVMVATGLWSVAALVMRRVPGITSVDGVRRVKYAGVSGLYGAVALACLLHGTGRWPWFWSSYVTGDALMAFPAQVPGVSFWFGCLLAAMSLGWAVIAARGSISGGIIPGFVLVAGAWLTQALAEAPPISGHFSAYWRRPYSETGVRLRALRQADDALVVWGARPQIYVESGFRSPVNSSVTSGELLATNPARDRYRARFLAEMLAEKPSYFVDGGAPGIPGYADRARSGMETFPALRKHVENYFTLLKDDGQTRLYARQASKKNDYSNLTVARLELPKIAVLQSVGSITETDQGRWFAHAPSRFSYRPPEGLLFVQGYYGFLSSAYGNTGTNTDGATFIIEASAADGERVRLLERKLTPQTNPDDRGVISFRAEIPPGKFIEIEFLILSGPSSANDWTYWGNLEFGH